MEQTRKVPVRTCTGCGKSKNKKELIRVVRDKEGNIFVDFTGKKNGRGAYICPNEQCLERAVKNKGLERTLKIPRIDDDIYQQLRKGFRKANE